MNQQLPLAVYYEHPEWFRPLFAEMDRRSIQYLRIDAGCHVYDATATDRKYALVLILRRHWSVRPWPAKSILGSIALLSCRSFFQSAVDILRESRLLVENFCMRSKSIPQERTLICVRLRYAGPKTAVPLRIRRASSMHRRPD